MISLTVVDVVVGSDGREVAFALTVAAVEEGADVRGGFLDVEEADISFKVVGSDGREVEFASTLTVEA